MLNETAASKPSMRRGTLLIRSGQPITVEDVADAGDEGVAEPSLVLHAAGRTLSAYLKAARRLLEAKYASQEATAPLHLRKPCNVWVFECSDGILVRYDVIATEQAKMRVARVDRPLKEVTPEVSELVLHFPDDPAAYVPAPGGPEVILSRGDAAGLASEIARIRLLVYAGARLPEGVHIPPPPARPPCLVSITNNWILEMHGVSMPSDHPPDELKGPDIDHFILTSSMKLPVGWEAIEVYPPLGDNHWKPEYAENWAELDILAAIVRSNARVSQLNALDPRAATRDHYNRLLEEFESLLEGPEEPVHQFLKKHPELLCPTAERTWSKLAFGKSISDFVFREPHNDYLLVELEAPIRELFRKDGQQREELTHALNQIADWVQYLQNNRSGAEQELGLPGISTNPRTLVVIGRSRSLTEADRRKLGTLQAQQNKLRILTYDDLLEAARASLERILGPLGLKTRNAKLYFFKSEVDAERGPQASG